LSHFCVRHQLVTPFLRLRRFLFLHHSLFPAPLSPSSSLRPHPVPSSSRSTVIATATGDANSGNRPPHRRTPVTVPRALAHLQGPLLKNNPVGLDIAARCSCGIRRRNDYPACSPSGTVELSQRHRYHRPTPPFFLRPGLDLYIRHIY
jgi:hypothetical protein